MAHGIAIVEVLEILDLFSGGGNSISGGQHGGCDKLGNPAPPVSVLPSTDDGKSRDSNSSETSPGDMIHNAGPKVTGRPGINKSQLGSGMGRPLENLTVSPSYFVNNANVPDRSRATAADTRLESHILASKIPPCNPKGQSTCSSSSDPKNPPYASNGPRNSRDGDSERPSSKNHSSKKRPCMKSTLSPKKIRVMTEPRTKQAEEDQTCGEVSSKVLGYVLCDSLSGTTTATPPMESDFVKAPDNSLHTSLMPSPAVSPQPVYYSYFEKLDHKVDTFSRDHDSYLQEGRKLKASVAQEGTITAKATKYLEAGLCFILTGVMKERDYTFTCNNPYRIYKETLSYIQFIIGGLRSRLKNLTALEAKIVVLCMRCQALLSMKLFNMKFKETVKMGEYLEEHFLMAPPAPLPAPINPQLSTSAPETSSTGSSGTSVFQPQHLAPPTPLPASINPQLSTSEPETSSTGSSGTSVFQPQHLAPPPPLSASINPQLSTSAPETSPTGPSGTSVFQLQHSPQHDKTIPQRLHTKIHKHCNETLHIIMAHDTWDQADSIVFKNHMEEFFVGIDRQFGPLTLHSSLEDLVRYVRQGIQLMNAL